MDRGWATGRGRALWTTLGIVVALVLIGGSLIALNRSLLSFDGWLSGSQPDAAQQTLPPEPDIVIGTRSIGGGTAAPPGGPRPGGGGRGGRAGDPRPEWRGDRARAPERRRGWGRGGSKHAGRRHRGDRGDRGDRG